MVIDQAGKLLEKYEPRMLISKTNHKDRKVGVSQLVCLYVSSRDMAAPDAANNPPMSFERLAHLLLSILLLVGKQDGVPAILW